MFHHSHKLSAELSDSDIFHSLNIFSVAFGQRFDRQYFERKYLRNPFGDSIHVFSYDDDRNLVATRVLWKLDSNIYYQCVDTAVHPFYQGRGLFKLSTSYILDTFPGLCFYNKPNSNSMPQYLKYGWKTDKIQNIGVSCRFSKRFLSSIPLFSWTKPQLKWRMSLTNPNKYKHFSRDGLYYVSVKKRGLCDMLLFKTPLNLSIPTTMSLFFFSFDAKTHVQFPYTQTLLSRCSGSYAPPSFYFDMT